MKTILFCPGFFENGSGYRKLFSAFQGAGYRAISVPIEWKRTTLDDWRKDLEKVYQKYDPKDVILAGFSFGAVTALWAASEKNPSELWLFSLSPYFTDDELILKPAKSDLRVVGKRRLEIFRNQPPFLDIAKQIKCKTKIFYGENELEDVIDRNKKAHKLIDKSQIVVVKGGRHNIDDDYIGSILGITRR